MIALNATSLEIWISCKVVDMGTNDDLLQNIEPSLGAAAPAQPESSSQGMRKDAIYSRSITRSLSFI